MATAQTSIQRTRIKFCGITRLADARLAVELGVDALGFVFVPKSRRYIEPENAAALRAALPPFICIVALFQDADAATVRSVIATLKPDLLQFHGGEDAAYCEQFDLPYLKAVSMQDPMNLVKEGARHPKAQALLLDSHAGSGLGGTGTAFDWSGLPPTVYTLVLAGGLDAGNVSRAIHAVRPYAVDVSSGIEQLVEGEPQPGLKDAGRMRQFVLAVRGHGRPPFFVYGLVMFITGLMFWLLAMKK